MFNEVKAGDTVLVCRRVFLSSADWRTIEYKFAHPEVVERVTATQVIIDGTRYRKDTGRQIGQNYDSSHLINIDKPTDQYGNTYQVMTTEQAEAFKDGFDRFGYVYEHIYEGKRRNIKRFEVYHAYLDADLREEVLKLDAEFTAKVKALFQRSKVPYGDEKKNS